MSSAKHVVAVVGGATAGAEAAALLAERGVVVVVFEQNPRPYGKIEDGLPRWHVRLRRKEYETINDKLTRPGVHFVPCTKVGRDIELRQLTEEWGFSAVVLAHGAWRDRPFPVPGAEAYLGKGLLYQNAFIQWFNHAEERGYRGPRYEVVDGALVVGGGLASLDVVKALQLQTTREALAERGIDEDLVKLEQVGIPGVLDEHGFVWEDLGLRGCTLVYRRRIEDMPLTDMPPDADPATAEKVESMRRRILEKAMTKYCFRVAPLRIPVGLLTRGDRLVGLKLQRTRVEHGEVVPVEGAVEDVRAPLVVSSIGSVPEPMPGLEHEGLLYRWEDPMVGRLGGLQGIFGTGNVVTGKGNIVASRRHSAHVTGHVIEQFLGVGNGRHDGEEALAAGGTRDAAAFAGRVLEGMRGRGALEPAQVDALLARVHARQEAVGYHGDYREWLEQVTPPDMV